jgi:chromosome segregation ATPase
MTEEEKKRKSEEEEKNLGVLAEDEEEKVEEEKKRQKAIASELVLNLKVEVDKYKQSAESLKKQMLEATEKAEKASSEFDSMKEQRNRLARELSELELETAAKDDEIKELNEFLVSSEKDFEQSKMEELQSLRESLEQMKEEKKAAEVLARAYKQDFVQERELNAKFREEKNQMMEEKTKSERELRAAANESEMKLSAAMRENAELKKIWDSDRKVIEILTKKLDEMSEKPGLGAAIVNTYSTVKTVIPKYSSVIASTTMNTTKGVVSKTTDISGKFFSAVKTKLEKIKEDELALMDEEEDDDEFEDSDVRTGIFL